MDEYLCFSWSGAQTLIAGSAFTEPEATERPQHVGAVAAVNTGDVGGHSGRKQSAALKTEEANGSSALLGQTAKVQPDVWIEVCCGRFMLAMTCLLVAYVLDIAVEDWLCLQD